MQRGENAVSHVMVSRPAGGLGAGRGRLLFVVQRCRAHGRASADGARQLIAFWLYSSGSTGRPKGAVHSHANLVAYGGVLRAGGARAAGKRRYLLGGEAVLRLRARQCADVSALGRGDGGAAGGASNPRRGLREAGDAQGHRVRRGADAVRSHAGRAGLASRADVALRRCVSAGEALPGRSASGSPRASVATSSTASDRPRCCISSCRIARGTFVTGPRARRCRVTLELPARRGIVADGENGELFMRGASGAVFPGRMRRDRARRSRGMDPERGPVRAGRATGSTRIPGGATNAQGRGTDRSRLSRSKQRSRATKRCSRPRSSARTPMASSGARVRGAQGRRAGDDAIAEELKVFIKGQLAPYRVSA